MVSWQCAAVSVSLYFCTLPSVPLFFDKLVTSDFFSSHDPVS